MSELKELFEKMTVDNLSRVIKALGIKATSRIKADRVQILINYYSDKDCIKKIWDSLDAYEKDLLTCIVQSNYKPHNDDLNKIVKKHSVNLNTPSYRYGVSGYFREDSKLSAIIIDGKTPNFIRLELSKLVVKYTPKFKIRNNVDTDDYEGRIVDRDDRYSDFDMLIKFVNNQNVPATKAAGLINKNSLIKFHKIAGSYEDIFKGDILEIGEIRKSSETTVSYGMVQLLLAADVLEIYKEKFKLGKCVTYFIGLDMAQKAQFLFYRFMTDKHIIDECRSITANKFYFSRESYDLTSCRQAVIDVLKMCPAGKWIEAGEFKKQIRRSCNNFLRSVVKDVDIRDEYYKQYFNTPSWDEFEFYFIDVMLMEYLAVLGAVDVVTNNHSDDYDTRTFPVIECFRITELGMFLFGVNKEYTSKQKPTSTNEKGFIVQPNFDIIVSNGTQRMSHEIYFERFLTKTTDDTEVSVFKLEFFGIVKALEIGIKIQEIYDYLKSCSTVPIPENVVNTIRDWETQANRIQIRTVTIVEADDNFLLEEIKSYKGMKENMLGEIKNAVVISPQKSQKVKKLIEKNKRFCILSE